MNLSQNNQIFLEALSRLNSAQKQAVEHIEGPVLVLAGPGTGKTQLLSARIGNILLNTDAQAHNILCLTYTDAGTIAMRKRLLQFIGPEAYKVNIFTFHGFCNMVIQENLEYFGVRDLQPISELELVDVLCKLVDCFATDHPLKKFTGDIYYNTGRLKELFKTMKSENFSPEFISTKIDEYLESLPLREKFSYKRANATKGIKAGDPNTKLIEEETEKMEALRAAANELPKYEKLMRELKRYDFQDMIDWVLKAFEKNEALLARYQEKYLYILVDEFQDTNGAQNEVLQHLTSFWDSPNLFVVGDDDQSIYSFQGANLSRINAFVDKYEQDLYPVVLTENYRSTQQILDASKAVIENNTERLIYEPVLQNILPGLHKNLESKKEDSGQTDSVKIREYLNPMQEEAGIVKEIFEAYSNGEDLSTIAILYRNHRNIEGIMKALDHLKIPYNARMRANILELPFVKNLLLILQYIQEESVKPNSAEHLLFALMHIEFFGIDPRDIAIISKDCAVKENGEFRSWRSLISSKTRMLNLGLISAGAISQLEENLTYWLKGVHNLTLQMLFEKIISHGKVLSYIMKSQEKVWLLEVLNTFFDFIKDESSKRPNLSIGTLLDMIRKMEENRIALPLQKMVQAEKGVHLITAHSSKGLEFEKVYLINCSSDSWEKKRAANQNFRLPDTIAPVNQTNKHEEERRLFYVAMTRARKELVISYPFMKMSDKDPEQSTLEKSAFVAELLEKIPFETERVHLSENDIVSYTVQTMTSPTLDQMLIEKAFIAEVLKNYKLSVTHLNKYLRCPVSFYFENILRVPSARSVSMGFGNAIHYSLEKLFREMLAHEAQEFPTLERFIQFFKIGMMRHASHFTQQEFELKMEYSGILLPEFYKQYKEEWHKKVTVEYRVNQAEIEGIPITGALDKIEFDGKSCNVVDYKTGDPLKAREKLRKPDEKTPAGGDYWRQVVFYKLLLNSEKHRKWNMISGEIDFVQKAKGKDSFEKVKVYVQPEDIQHVKDQIREVYDNIINHRFTPGCGEDDCTWCNFVKFNYRAEALVTENQNENFED